MTDRNLNKVKKLPTETWAQTLAFANKQIELLLQRCDDLVKARDQAIAQSAHWHSEYLKRDAQLVNNNQTMELQHAMLIEQSEAISGLEGYIKRVREEDDRRG